MLPGQIAGPDLIDLCQAFSDNHVEKERLAGRQVQLFQTGMDNGESPFPLAFVSDQTLQHIPFTAAMARHQPQRLRRASLPVSRNGGPPGIVLDRSRLSDKTINGTLPVPTQHGGTDQVRIALGTVALMPEIVGYAAPQQHGQDCSGCVCGSIGDTPDDDAKMVAFEMPKLEFIAVPGRREDRDVVQL